MRFVQIQYRSLFHNSTTLYQIFAQYLEKMWRLERHQTFSKKLKMGRNLNHCIDLAKDVTEKRDLNPLLYGMNLSLISQTIFKLWGETMHTRTRARTRRHPDIFSKSEFSTFWKILNTLTWKYRKKNFTKRKIPRATNGRWSIVSYWETTTHTQEWCRPHLSRNQRNTIRAWN